MEPALIGDIGGTNARFALLRNGTPAVVRILGVEDHASLAEAIQTYLRGIEAESLPRPRRAALAVAGPVTGDFLSFTNHPWSFSIAALQRDLGFDRLDIVNDFVAAALAMPRLGPGDRRQVGPGAPVDGAPIAVIGPGSGLGVSMLVSAEIDGSAGRIAIPGEGGHVTLATIGPREAAIVDWLHRGGRGHVSAESLISGPGLATLHAALCALDGAAVADLEPAALTALAARSEDARAVEAVAIFCALLGTVAGNLALTVGARGGVYIAGGIVPQLGDIFDRSQFRERFVAKGRMRSYLDPIPTYVVTHKLPAFLGLAELAERA